MVILAKYQSLLQKFDGKFNEDVSRFYAAQIISALEYMHERNIMHRDLKPENLVLTESFDIKIVML